MCGICGIVHSDPQYHISRERLIAMRDRLVHRGPDDAGEYLAPGIGLGSRRLIVLDLTERGHMPMSTPDGRYWITYNGEVYNYRELRSMLEGCGHRFRSKTDTEVVLYLYAEEGPAMLDRLNGMFAMAIWDNRERTLFLARDRLGIKPLYYTVWNDAFYFASEEKALFAAGIPADFDAGTLEELLCFRYVAGERTPFVGIKRLLPGHYLLWRDGQITIRRWWHLANRIRVLRENPPRHPPEWFRETFDSAVALRRISDVPIGVLLSGGLDSSSVAASLAVQTGERLASFTVRFDESDYDEGPLAAEVARRWQLQYHELMLSRDELLQRLQRASWLNDEPLVHGNDPHLLAISELAKSHVTVLLSGEGGDEILGGYVRYQPLRYPALLNAARPFYPRIASLLRLDGRLGKLARFLKLGSIDGFVLFNACDILPSDLRYLGMIPRARFPYREQILTEAKALYPGDPFRQAMYSDQHTFLCSILDRNDRMTMGASIECRVPFLDHRLVEGLAALPSTVLVRSYQMKRILRRSIGQRLPRPVLNHRKWGFGVPWGRYFRGVTELREFIRALPEMKFIRDAPFDRRRVRGLIDEFFEGDARCEPLVRQLVMLAVWYETCIVLAWSL